MRCSSRNPSIKASSGTFLLADSTCPLAFFQNVVLTTARVKLVLTDFEGVDQFSPAGVKQYEKALLKAESEGTKIRALMLVNPHNPLGICYPKETIIEMMKLCQKYSIHLLCDEIYATSVYDVGDPHALPFTSALSFDHTPYIDTDLLHILYGMSKDLAAGGTRLGCIYLRHKNLAKAMRYARLFGGIEWC